MIAWVEIPTVDFDRAVEFYNAILGLKLEKQDFGTEKMACFPDGSGAIIWSKGYEPSGQGVVVSLHTDEMEKALERIPARGGKVLIGKTKIEAEGRGYFGVFTDTEGNRLGLYSEN